MQVKYENIDDCLFIYLIGELDQHYAKGVKDYIEQIIDTKKGFNVVIFDLSELKFMDSTGIGMLLGRYKKLKKLGIMCYISNPQASVEKVIELSGIYKVMPKM